MTEPQASSLAIVITHRIEAVLSGIDEYLRRKNSPRLPEPDCPISINQGPTRPGREGVLGNISGRSEKIRQRFIPKSKVSEALEAEQLLFAEVFFPKKDLELSGYICLQNQEGRIGIYFLHSITGEVMSVDIELASVKKLRKLTEKEREHLNNSNGLATALLTADLVTHPSLEII